MDREQYIARRDAYNRIITFRDVAVQDGWAISPTYGNESQEAACTLERDGMKIQIITRDNGEADDTFRYCAGLHMWGADGLAITPTYPYSFHAICTQQTICDFCEQHVQETFRVAFANRSCKDCLATAKQKLEYPGWCN